MSGPLLETWVLAELLKGYWHNGPSAPFHYYRDHFQSLGRLRLPIGAGGVICLTQEFLPLGATTHAIPVGAL